MPGPFALRTQKALLTRYCNNLDKIVTQYGDEKPLQQSSDPSNVTEPTSSAIYELRAAAKLVSDQLATLVTMVDSMEDQLPEEQEAQLFEYIEKAHTSLDRAENLAIQLESRRINARESALNNAQTALWTPERSSGQLEMMAPKLPPIPIPTFDGKIWDFVNFWNLFDTNVNSQNSLTNLQKFNYLLNALRGEARDLARRYPITDDNYELAIDSLRKKYGNNSQLIGALKSRLEGAKVENHSTSGQRRLLEFIIPLVTQLQKLGVQLDGSYNMLSKAPRTQRKVLEKIMTTDMEESHWRMKEILDALDAFISTEERIDGLVSHEGKYAGPESRWRGASNKNTHRISSPCLFCNSAEHKSAVCPKYSTIEERRSFLQENKMCLNCGRDGHFVKDCTREGCRNCQGRKHYHALCPLKVYSGRQSSHSPSSVRKQSTGTVAHPNAGTDSRSSRSQRQHKITQATPVQVCTTEKSLPENNCEMMNSDVDAHPTVLHNKMDEGEADKDKVLLLTGIARIWNHKQNKWQHVEVLFDTGANQSFISQVLAKDAGFECTEVRDLSMYTFGAKSPKSTTCGVTFLDLWDNHGERHNVRLFTAPALSIFNALNGRMLNDIKDIYILSDSQIALSWLGTSVRDTSPGLLVNNRLKEIRSIVKTLDENGTSVHFMFVPTDENPADAGTRGLTKAQLNTHAWWNGPEFLRRPIETWPTTSYYLSHGETESTELCTQVIYATNPSPEADPTVQLLDLKRFSTLKKAKKVMALVLLFLKKLLRRLSESRQHQVFERIPELKNFPEEANSIGGKAIIASRSAIIRNYQAAHIIPHYRKSVENTLRLFKDGDGMWRSKGRIGNSSLNSDAKSPIFISPKTPLATLIVNEAHGEYHQGIEHTMSTIRMNYWIPRLRQQVRYTIKTCVKCHRFNGLPYENPETTDLPHRRFLQTRTFQHIGLDFFDLPLIREEAKT